MVMFLSVLLLCGSHGGRRSRGLGATVAPTQHRHHSVRRLHLNLHNPRLGRPEVTSEDEAMDHVVIGRPSVYSECAKFTKQLVVRSSRIFWL